MHLYFLRHAQSIGNASGDYSTLAHDNLSDAGQEQAQELAQRLEAFHFDKVYCSPLGRTIQTITPYVDANARAVEIWPELAEACWQEDRSVNQHEELEFVNSDESGVHDHPHFDFRDQLCLRPIEEETFSQGLFRLKQAVKLLQERHLGNGEHLLIVSHGFAIAHMIEILLDMESEGRIDHGNTGMSLLSQEVDDYKIQYINRYGYE